MRSEVEVSYRTNTTEPLMSQRLLQGHLRKKKMMKWFSIKMPNWTRKNSFIILILMILAQPEPALQMKVLVMRVFYSDSMINTELTRHDIVRRLNPFCFHWHRQCPCYKAEGEPNWLQRRKRSLPLFLTAKSGNALHSQHDRRLNSLQRELEGGLRVRRGGHAQPLINKLSD